MAVVKVSSYEFHNMGTLNNANTEQMEHFRYSEGTLLCIRKWSNLTDRAFLVTTYMFNVSKMSGLQFVTLLQLYLLLIQESMSIINQFQ